MSLKSFTVAIALTFTHSAFTVQRHADLFFIWVSAFLLLVVHRHVFISTRTNKTSTGCLAIGFILICLLNIVYLASSAFTGKGITQQTLDHFNVRSLEAGFVGWFDYYWGLILVLAIFLFAWFSKPNQSVRSSAPISGMLLFTCLTLSSIVHPATYDLAKGMWYAKINRGADALLMKHYRRGNLSDQTIAKVRSSSENLEQKSVLVIYLEGYERAALDQSMYPNLANNLRALERQGNRYGQFLQAHGANHTIAGLVSSQCGIPYATTGGEGNLTNDGGGNYYMPHVQCLADVTKKLGYQNIYYQGGLLDFTRKGAFFSSHGYDEVNGINQPWDNIPKENRRGWGFHDDILIGYAKEKIEELMAEESSQPFLLTMLTLDTHDSDSYSRMSRSCYDRGVHHYAEVKEHPIQDQLLCSDFLVAEFVKQIQEKYSEDINIYLVSDHLPHAFSTMKGVYALKERELIFIALNGETSDGNRVFTHLDIAATILDDITHGQINRLGMGVSLKSTESTLIEKIGKDRLNEKINQSRRALADIYWEYPKLQGQSLEFDSINKEIRIGNASFPIPVAFQLDDNQKILSYYSSEIDRYLKISNASDGVIYVDKCSALADYQTHDLSSNSYCLMAGNLGSNELFIKNIDNKNTLPVTEFSAYFDAESTPGQYLRRVYERPSKWTSKIKSLGSKAVYPLAEIVFSTGGDSKQLMVTNYWDLSKFEKFKGFKNHRPAEKSGLYLFQIKGGAVNLIKQWTACNDKGLDNAKKVINNSKASEFVLMTGIQGLTCSSLGNKFEDTPFSPQISSLQKQHAYIGYWNKEKDDYQFILDKSGTATELRLIDNDTYQSLPF